VVETRRQRAERESLEAETEVETTSSPVENNTMNGDTHHDDKTNDVAAAASSSPDKDNKDAAAEVKEVVEEEEEVTTSKRAFFLFFILMVISYVTFPETLQPQGRPTVQHVWYFGWLSAISTGLGVLPLVLVPDLDDYYVGVANAVAAGMMAAASYSLFLEGCTFEEADDITSVSPTVRTVVGAALGLLFILCTKSFLEQHEDLKVGSLGGADLRKVLLIVFVMTLHSFSEGVGIGVSFGGENGSELGVFISASLAVHNVPEGLAVAVVLLPRKVSKLTASLWCIMTSLPQPLMAVPAFLFVHYFIPILPVGLGFAGGAMAWVALFELLMEAYEDTDITTTAVVSSVSLAIMIAITGSIDEGSRTHIV